MLQSTWSTLFSEFSGIPWVPPAAWAMVPPHPGLTISAFLAAAFGFLVAAGAFVLCLAVGWRTAARRIAMVATAGAGLYLAALAVVGAASGERTLPPGGKKYFCEIDCHLAYSVLSEEATSPIRRCGPSGDGLRVVRVETTRRPSRASAETPL